MDFRVSGGTGSFGCQREEESLASVEGTKEQVITDTVSGLQDKSSQPNANPITQYKCVKIDPSEKDGTLWRTEETEKYRSMGYTIRSSKSDPYTLYRVSDQISIGMCPGRFDTSPKRALCHSRDMDADLSALAAAGVNVVVCMLSKEELEKNLHVHNYADQLSAHGIQFIEFPFDDDSLPKDYAELVKMVRHLKDLVYQEKKIHLHCSEWAGALCDYCRVLSY